MSTQEQEPLINACPECGEGIDVSDQPPYAKIECPHCHDSIRVRTQLGQYQVQRLLGEGGMSQVFLAIDETLGRSVALKVLHKELSRDEKLTASFEREAKITASINHPNVVKVYTVGSDYGYFFIAMELVDNVSLEELITNHARVAEVEVMQIAHDVTSGLYAALKAGLIHRDIKPGNILLTNDGNAKLVDFGLAVQTGYFDADEDVWATPFYVPPEKLEGEPDDFRGDIYSLGATLFHAVTGTPPYAANTASLDELKKIKAKTIRLIETAPDSRKPTCRLIDRMMARKPGDRHQDYKELLAEIDEATAKLGGRKSSSSGMADIRADESEEQPIWKKKPVMIAAGLTLLAGLGFVFLGNTDDDLSAALLSGGTDRVLTAGEQSGATKYLKARKLFIEGQVADAETSFMDVLDEGELNEPTRKWAKFNLGVCLLLKGDEEEARKHFLELTKLDEVASSDKSVLALNNFFGQAGFALSDKLPVRNDAFAFSIEGPPYESVAYLAFGLKNWHQSKFKPASRFFRLFQSAFFPPPYTWIEGLKEQVADYRQDGEIVADPNLPNPQISMTNEELEGARKVLTQAKQKLKTTGSALKFLEGRLDRIPNLIKEKARLAALPKVSPLSTTIASIGNTGPQPPDGVPQPNVTGVDPDSESLEELKKLWSVEEVAQGLGENFEFSEAMSRFESVTTETPLIKELLADEMKIVKRAESFLGLLLNKLNESNYEGEMIRKEGVPLDAKIAGATRAALSVDLGFGRNEVALEEFAPSWLITVAGEMFNNAEGNPELLADAVSFAWATGEHKTAIKMTNQEANFPEEFKIMWKRLMMYRPR